MAERKIFCYNCFQEKPDEGPCPHCGFDLEENATWRKTRKNSQWPCGPGPC